MSGNVIYVEDFVELRSLTGMQEGLVAFVKEYHVGTGVGGGELSWDGASNESENKADIFMSDAGGVGRWKRTDPIAVFQVVNWGLVADDPTRGASNAEVFDRLYNAEESERGLKFYLPNGNIYTTHPIVADGFQYIGVSSVATNIILTEGNAPMTPIPGDAGSWGIVDFNVVSPCIASNKYYSGFSQLTAKSEEIIADYCVYTGVSRWHKYDDLHLLGPATTAFRSQGGFLTDYGNMEVRNCENGVIIGPGPSQVGGNNPTFGRLWINGTTGLGFQIYGMTEAKVDKLYFESCSGQWTYFRTARNMTINSINVDNCTIGKDSGLKFRGCYGTIEGLYLNAISAFAPNSPIFGENGGGTNIAINTLRHSSIDVNVCMAARLPGSGATKITISHGDPSKLIGELSSNNVDSQILYGNVLDREFDTYTADSNYSVVLATIKNSDMRFSFHVKDVCCSNQAGNFNGVDEYYVNIDSSGVVSSQRYIAVDVSSVSPAADFFLVETPGSSGHLDLVISRSNTAFSRNLFSVRGGSRLGSVLKGDFYL